MRLKQLAWAAPLLAVCGLLSVTVWLYSVVYPATSGWAMNVTIAKQYRTPGDQLAGLVWGGAAIAFTFVAASAAVAIGITTRGALRGLVKKPNPSTVTIAIVAMAVIGGLVSIENSPLSTKPYVTGEIFAKVFSQTLQQTIRCLWYITLATAGFVVMGASASVAEQASSIPAIRAEQIREQSACLQIVLFAGAAVLVIGVLELEALYHWAAGRANVPDTRAFAQSITASATIPTGTFFSLFLAAVYLPAAVIIRQRARELVRKEQPSGTVPEQKEWLEKQGLNMSIAQNVASVIAMLAPALAGGPLAALGHLVS